MWFDCTNNCLQHQFETIYGLAMAQQCRAMFVNLNINYLVNCFEFLYTDFVQGLLYLEILCCPGFAIVHVVFIRSYGLGGEHYSMFICD